MGTSEAVSTSADMQRTGAREVRKWRESKAELVRKRNTSEVDEKGQAKGDEETLNPFLSGDWPIAGKESEVTAAIAGDGRRV